MLMFAQYARRFLILIRSHIICLYGISFNTFFHLQDFDNNGDFWNRLEIYCRDLTKKFEDVHVISGPMWIPR